MQSFLKMKINKTIIVLSALFLFCVTVSPYTALAISLNRHDGLGSVAEITDSTGAIAENYTYDPYGNPSVINSTIGNRYRFTGQEFNEESGLYHYNRRTYDSEIGRFLQRDTREYEGGMNLYEYAYNSPINFVDPDGELAFIPLLIAAGSGAAISAGIEVTSQILSGRLEECGGLDYGAIGKQAAIGGAYGLAFGGVGIFAKSVKFLQVGAKLSGNNKGFLRISSDAVKTFKTVSPNQVNKLIKTGKAPKNIV